MEQQTWLSEFVVGIEFRLTTCAHWERSQQQIQSVTNRPRMRVGTEVLGALLPDPPHNNSTRPFFVKRHSQKRVTLIVAQADIETRPMLLDQ